jgi:hypothetical protein
MKTFLLVTFLLVALDSQAQNVLRVNSTNGIDVPYPTIALAVAAAGPTDIIMVEGSLNTYGDVTISKKVTIVGPGYFLTENVGLQANLQPASINSITINSGADGSSFSGLTLAGPGFIINGVNNVSITNSVFTGNGGVGTINLKGSALNILIKGNYFIGNSGSINSSAGSYTGAILTNNYISGNNPVTGVSSIWTIENNMFDTPNNNGDKLLNSDIRNNIFINSIGTTTGSTIKYNVFVASSQAGADATNSFNATTTALFVGLPGNTTDSQWKLKSGSSAIGFGEGGVDCGMYGGSTPYALSGIAPGQATITDFLVPATVPQNGTLNVKVSAKVN